MSVLNSRDRIKESRNRSEEEAGEVPEAWAHHRSINIHIGDFVPEVEESVGFESIARAARTLQSLVAESASILAIPAGVYCEIVHIPF
jgi:hypothetical protein